MPIGTRAMQMCSNTIEPRKKNGIPYFPFQISVGENRDLYTIGLL